MISAAHPLTPSCVLFLFLCQRLRVRQHFKMQTPLPRCPRWPRRVMAAAGGHCGLLSLQYRLAALLARFLPPCRSFVHSAPTRSSLASLHEAVPKITLQEHFKKRGGACNHPHHVTRLLFISLVSKLTKLLEFEQQQRRSPETFLLSFLSGYVF